MYVRERCLLPCPAFTPLALLISPQESCSSLSLNTPQTRDHSVPDALPVHTLPAVDPLELTDIFRGSRRRAGTGPSGRRNEYLRALVGDFGDSPADRVMTLYNDFATRAVNAQYPHWFYAAWAAASMLDATTYPSLRGNALRLRLLQAVILTAALLPSGRLTCAPLAEL